MKFIKTSRHGSAGFITLDRPAALNSLTHDMVVEIHAALVAHEADNNVEVIVVNSSSDRAFCAGGDMKTIRTLALDEKWHEINQFFEKEYALNLHIAQCSKPYISVINGVSMGGGLGLSVHGDAVIVCENSIMAMPETAIGFFPDVGSTYFLNQLPDNAGKWLSISGTTLKGDQSVSVGLATHYVESIHWTRLIEAFAEKGAAAINSVLPALSSSVNDSEYKRLCKHRVDWFGAPTNDELFGNLQSASQNSVEAMISKDAAALLKQVKRLSPYAMNLTRQLLIEAKGLNLSNCLQLELKTTKHAVRHPDFIEGVRAVLIDKEPAAWNS